LAVGLDVDRIDGVSCLRSSWSFSGPGIPARDVARRVHLPDMRAPRGLLLGAPLEQFANERCDRVRIIMVADSPRRCRDSDPESGRGRRQRNTNTNGPTF